MAEPLRITFDDWRPVGGRMEPHAVTFSGPLSVHALRQVALTRLINERRRELWQAEPARAGSKPARPRTRRLTLDELSETADVYRAAQRWGHSPTQTVAKQQGLTYTTAAKRVMRAREAGLLPATENGQARA